MDIQITRHPGAKALETLALERAAAKTAGLTAVLLGERWAMPDAAPRDAAALATLLAQAETFDVGAWLDGRREEHARQVAEMVEHSGMPELGAELIGDWPGELQHMGPTLHRDIRSRKPHDAVAIARVAVPAAWQLPAAFGYGGWNACPDAIVQTAMAKRWSAFYDADIIGMSGDVIEWEVRKPPRTKEAAMTLAWEQFLFCGDIVDLGVQTISNLGGGLLNGGNWFFWWD